MTFIPEVRTGRGPGGELIVGEKTLQFYASPSFGPSGISIYRDTLTENGGATVTVDNESEYDLTTGATGTDDCALDSAIPMRFYPGQGCEIGFSIRIPAALTGFAEWGMDDGETGVGFGRNPTGYFVYVRRNSVQTKVQSSSWNVDPLNGLGPSGLTLDATTATRFTVEFSSTFLGLIEFNVYVWNTSKELVKVTVHRWSPLSGAVDGPPCAPLRVLLDNNSVATAQSIFCQERWFATVGALREPIIREVFQFRLNQAPGTTPIPVITFRRKSGAGNQRPVIYITGFDLIISGADLIVKIGVDPVLTGDSFGTGQTDASETSTEVDISATTLGSVSNQFQGLFAAGSHSFNFAGVDKIQIPLGTREVGMNIRTTTGTASRVDTVIRLAEEW